MVRRNQCIRINLIFKKLKRNVGQSSQNREWGKKLEQSWPNRAEETHLHLKLWGKSKERSKREICRQRKSLVMENNLDFSMWKKIIK